MITRPIKGQGFRGLLNYLAEPEHARLLGGNMQGQNPRELAREFGLVRRQRPGVRRAVAHMFLRPAPGEFFSDQEWQSIASYFVSGMGFDESPHVVYLHAEPHPHIHIVASRITYDRKVVSDSNDYARASVLLRNIERRYGLRVVPTHPEIAAPSLGDFGRSRRTQLPPLKTRLQEILGSVEYPLTLAAYLDHLHRQGVTLLPNLARTGHVSGISYLYEGNVMKASDLGRNLSWAALRKRLFPSPDDSAQLVAERERAQQILSPGSPVPAAPVPPDPSLRTPEPIEPRRAPEPPDIARPRDRREPESPSFGRDRQSGRGIDQEIRDLDLSALATAFRSQTRFAPEPAFFLPPAPERLPALAAEARAAFDGLAAAERALRSSTPETYPALALTHAARAASVERLERELATFGPEPVPRGLPADRLALYLETRFQLHEAVSAPPSPGRDRETASLAARLAELAPRPEGEKPRPPLSERQLQITLTEQREAHLQLHRELTAPAPELGTFRAAVERSLDRHADLERFGIRLEARLHALHREHSRLSTRLGDSGEELPSASRTGDGPPGAPTASRQRGLAEPQPESPRLHAIERRVQTLEPLFLRARLGIADRDLGLLERHFLTRPSTETLDRYTGLLRDRERLEGRHREIAERRPSPPKIDLDRARFQLLQEPSGENLLRYRQAVSAATVAEERRSFAEAAAALTRHRGDLASALQSADRQASFARAASTVEDRRGRLAEALRETRPVQSSPATSPRAAESALRTAASRYIESRERLADHAPLPPRRGTTFDYATHARQTDLSPASLDRLRRSAVADLRRSPALSPLPRPQPVDAGQPGLSRAESLRLAVARLQSSEAALQAQLRGLSTLERRALPGSRPQATPETYRRLVATLDRHRQALADVERLSRPRLLSPREFLRHRAFRNRPQEGLAAWIRHASRSGLSPSRIGGALRSLALPSFAGAGVRAAKNLATRFLHDQVHER